MVPAEINPCLINENVRLKSQEEVSEAVNSVLFWQSSSLVTVALTVCKWGKGVVLSEQFRGPDRLCVWA